MTDFARSEFAQISVVSLLAYLVGVWRGIQHERARRHAGPKYDPSGIKL